MERVVNPMVIKRPGLWAWKKKALAQVRKLENARGAGTWRQTGELPRTDRSYFSTSTKFPLPLAAHYGL